METSNGMNNQKNKQQDVRKGKAPMRPLGFFVEFVKFASGFAAIVAVALLFLHVASAAM